MSSSILHGLSRVVGGQESVDQSGCKTVPSPYAIKNFEVLAMGCLMEQKSIGLKINIID